ncbi:MULTISPECIES: metallophosphoesterase family protein [Sporosarcina]|uniref:metallophosphoesterase family protein n=1 Tax=Sporosarcina TaxID=1569 RepID=UPI00058B2A63|nr:MULTISPECIES: metallophosphoesterase family protein [Sporosarcina]WJY28554.1 metallophosphoesterase family protein [Sporosarcina sp. 0.2-SM1T-5]
MRYALFGDIHSSKHELEQVLSQIEEQAPDAKKIVLGDLFECTISKKDLDGTVYPSLDDVLLDPPGFERMLKFPSIRGNQEERILLVTRSGDPLREKIAALPERMAIDGAMLIHGHQWPYNELPPSRVIGGERLTFHGHTHRSSWSAEGIIRPFVYSELIRLPDANVIVNVGSVTDHLEWVLYDSVERTITFMKAR